MELHFGKNTFQMYRNTWRDIGVSHNIGLGQVKRIERATLKLAFVELRLRWIVVAFYRQLAPIEPMTVGERGVW